MISTNQKTILNSLNQATRIKKIMKWLVMINQHKITDLKIKKITKEFKIMRMNKNIKLT